MTISPRASIGALLLPLLLVILPSGTHGDRSAQAAAPSRELGVRVQVAEPGQLVAVRYYRGRGDRLAHVVRVWGPDGHEAASATLPARRRTGWQRVNLPTALAVTDDTYTLSVGVRSGHKPAMQPVRAAKGAGFTVRAGVKGTRGQLPTTRLRKKRPLLRPVIRANQRSTEFPNADNTGVPAGVALTAYSGPRVVRTAGAVIDASTVAGPLTIEAPGVQITRSHITGNIVVAEQGSVVIADSVVDGGTFDGSAVGQYNITMQRVEVIGARQSVSCIDNCDIRDSWLHAQYIEPGSDWHADGFTSNGGSNVLLQHNTLACDAEPTGRGGACSAALASYGDFDAITNHTYDNNLFVASPAGYCMYGGYDPAKPYGAQVSGVVIINNVFERGPSGKCGVFGAVTAVSTSAPGNVFEGNTWSSGGRVRAQ